MNKYITIRVIDNYPVSDTLEHMKGWRGRQGETYKVMVSPCEHSSRYWNDGSGQERDADDPCKNCPGEIHFPKGDSYEKSGECTDIGGKRGVEFVSGYDKKEYTVSVFFGGEDGLHVHKDTVYAYTEEEAIDIVRNHERSSLYYKVELLAN